MEKKKIIKRAQVLYLEMVKILGSENEEDMIERCENLLDELEDAWDSFVELGEELRVQLTDECDYFSLLFEETSKRYDLPDCSSTFFMIVVKGDDYLFPQLSKFRQIACTGLDSKSNTQFVCLTEEARIFTELYKNLSEYIQIEDSQRYHYYKHQRHLIDQLIRFWPILCVIAQESGIFLKKYKDNLSTLFEGLIYRRQTFRDLLFDKLSYHTTPEDPYMSELKTPTNSDIQKAIEELAEEQERLLEELRLLMALIDPSIAEEFPLSYLQTFNVDKSAALSSEPWEKYFITSKEMKDLHPRSKFNRSKLQKLQENACKSDGLIMVKYGEKRHADETWEAYNFRHSRQNTLFKCKKQLFFPRQWWKKMYGLHKESLYRKGNGNSKDR
ncbi:hypothetical protein STSP2_01956 [Anaerohalosphaera lusitana]|uniref:Uncharacterized protein n=1 Tax=Anaerohalosphaera lusitana TaxID=1936003 RepID=A0A1U9NLH1_9BACT|nr:hypothetical protein [Anaerohalosphaera lusitana]AQT68783.1 hypothetical protein STSP2_01956 [Anaerohalosphaera lusitana]